MKLIEWFNYPWPTNEHGFSVHDIVGWDDQIIETKHDFIQWAFPLREPSRFNPDAPLMDDEFVNSYSLDCNTATRFLVKRMDDFYDSYTGWIRETDHNHLRITRIIKNLREQRLTDMANGFFAKRMNQSQGKIGAKSIDFWHKANKPL